MLLQNQFNRVYDKLRDLINIYSKQIYNKLTDLENVQYFETMEHYRRPPAEILPEENKQWKPAESGLKWGQTLGTAWFKASLKIPQDWEGKQIFIRSRTEAAEDMVFINNIPRGILTQTDNPVTEAHFALPVIYSAKGGEVIDIAVESYAGAPCIGCAPYESYGRNPESIYKHTHTYNGLEVCEQREDVLDFVIKLQILHNLYENTCDSFVKSEAMRCLEKVNCIIFEYPCEHSENEWRPPLSDAVKLIDKTLYSENGKQKDHTVSLVGHSHMDTAWLWPIRETVRKCARTYSNVLNMMDVFPEYTFTQSSSLHTDWMREYYPDIFEGIKKRVAENRYECNGGVWVECDCNITGGEAMLRQFLYGQKFTMEHFGKKSDCFWLPDTFGYSANIPQIMQGCDVKYFMTTKIGWNDTNSFHLDTFYWKGIDGSRVLSNFNCIGGPANPFIVIRRLNDIKDKRITDQTLVSYGMGDGGGGPSYEIIDAAHKIKDVSGMPQTKHTTVSEYMNNLEETAVDIPEYDGELYLELHRGTLTSKHQIKRNNRKAEIALHDMEFFNSVLMGFCEGKRDENIEKLYKRLLINQFHDILPGSSITEVHSLAIEEVSKLISDINGIIDSYTGQLVNGDDSITVFNTLSWERKQQFVINSYDGFDSFENAEVQHYTDMLGRKKTAVSGVCIAPLSNVVLKKSAGADSNKKSAFKYDGKTLSSPFAVMTFDDNGYIDTFTDITAKRSLVKDGGYPFNAFLCAEDVPRAWDNWDVDGDVEDKYVMQENFLGRELVSEGPLQIRLRSSWKIGKASKIVQDMVCYSDSPRIDFETVIYWEEKHIFLKTAFETNLRVTEAKNEIQYGYITRPTTRNDSVEAAKFEVSNHKWTDISENRYGTAVLNDCKYGISQKGGSLFLSLHKSGTRPDHTGDSGVHEVTYSFLPHNCGFSVPDVVMPSYELNYGVVTSEGIPCTGDVPVFQIDCDHVIIETIKPSEDGKAIVARLYEAEKSAALNIRLKPGFNFTKAEITNMLEEKICGLDTENGEVTLDFKAFEIKTIKFYL